MESVNANKSTTNGFNTTFFHRFWRLHCLFYPGLCSLPFGLFCLLLLFALFEELVVYAVGLIPSQFYRVLGDKDFQGFVRQTLQSLGIIILICVIKALKNYVSQILNLTWRQLLTRAAHRLYFTGTNYYRLNISDSCVDNPDQRITQDISKLCGIYSLVAVKIVVAPFTITYYTYQAYTSTGWVGPTSCFIFFILGSVVNKILMSPIVEWVVQQERREGDFRFKHMLIRSNAESLAFLSGARLEEDKTNKKLDALLSTQRHLYGRQLFLNLAVNLFGYLGSIVSYLALAVPIFAGQFDGVSSTELSALISQNSFVCIYLISTFTSLVDLSSNVTELAGVTHRVAELFERLQQQADGRNQRESKGICDTASEIKKAALLHEVVSTETGSSQKASLFLSQAAFRAPGGNQDLVKDLSIRLQPKENVLITGSSSTGKTSLFRVLRGLWRLARGTFNSTHPPGPQGILFLPQKPYFTDGTLREQITFPLCVDLNLVKDSETDQLLHYLNLLNLQVLLERVGGLDRAVDWNWYDVLSPGEMQRLSFIRLFYHRPQLAFLDEATSALDLEMEQLLYRCAIDKGITLISVGHRQSLQEYHDYQLHLGGDGTWTLQTIRKDK